MNRIVIHFSVARNEPFRFLLCQHRYEREEQRFSADREGFFANERDFELNPNEPMEPPRRQWHSPERDTNRQSSRSLSREDTRGGHFEENRGNDGLREERSSYDHRPSHNQHPNRPNQGGARGNFHRRGRFFRRGRGWGRGNRPQSQRTQNPPNDRPGFRGAEFADEPEPAWEQREENQAWDDGDEVQERGFSPPPDPEPQRPRNRPEANMMVITKETLKIRVDMSRPANRNR